MDDKFSNEEKHLIQDYAYSTPSRRIIFYLVIVLTPLMAEIYGIIEKDIPAMILGFIGLFVLLIWILISSWNDSKLLHSICSKLLSK